MAAKTVNMPGVSRTDINERQPTDRWPGAQTGDLIAKALQEHFEDVLAAPVPDKFLVLLAELEAREASAASATPAAGTAQPCSSVSVVQPPPGLDANAAESQRNDNR